MAGDREEELLRSAALQNAQSILQARRRAEEELARSLALLRATLESTTDGILAVDVDGEVTHYNGHFLEIWGFPREMLAKGRRNLWLQSASRLLREPARFIERTAKIDASVAPDSFDVLEFADGRVFERYSKLQYSEGVNVGRVWSFRDITARRQAEEALQQQREWFQVTLSSIGDAVITTDTEGRVTFLNPVAMRMTGWTIAEAAGKPLEQVFRIINEETRASIPNPVSRVLHEGVVVGLANHTALIARDGTEMAIEDSAAPIRDAAGKISGVVMVFHDVTARRKAESAFRRGEEVRARLAAVVASSDDAIVSKTLEGVIVTWNAGAERMFGYTADEAVGRPVTLLIPADRRDEETVILKRLRRGERIEHYETVRQRKDGTLVDVSLTVSPILDAEGRIIGASKIARDITEARKTMHALREQYAVTEHLNEVAKALATELDLDKVVQIITDAGTRITRAQFGAFFYNVPDDQGGSYMLYSLSGAPREAFARFPMPRATEIFGPTFRGEGVIRLDDVRTDPRFGRNAPHQGMPAGHLPVVSYLAAPVISRTGRVLGGLFFGHAEAGVFTVRDEKVIVGIAAQAAAAMDNAHLYQTEQQARAAAEKANQAKDHFLATLSHELRTPLAPVLAILSGLGEDPRVPEGLARDMETMRRNVELEARLIDDLLDVTRISRGKLKLQREKLAIGSVIENAINTCLADIEQKHLRLERDLQDVGLPIVADGARITQILWNLLKNAVKFTAENGVITVRSRAFQSKDGAPWVKVEVQDTGIGIEPEVIGRVFDAFEQGGRAITQQFGGLGLGLAISKAIAQAHGGNIVAHSGGVDRGSTFTLSLPAAPGEAPGAAPSRPHDAKPAASDRRTAPTKRHIRLLFVEDHRDTATVMTRMLERAGYVVFHAASVSGALEIASREMSGAGLDLVVSDLGLPDGSGLEIMRKLSQQFGLSGIALSGFGMESDREDTAAAGFRHHVTKPVDIGRLRNLIDEMTAGD